MKGHTSPRVLEYEICKRHHTATYTHIHTHTYTHVHTRTHTHTHTHACMHTPFCQSADVTGKSFQILEFLCFCMFYLHCREVSDISAAIERHVDTNKNRELIETVVQCTVVNL